MQISDVVCLRVLDASMTDWVLKDQMLELAQTPLKEIIVLPSMLRRTKQLLSRTEIKVGTVIDYPLAAGTVAKKAYEVGDAFKNGADFLEVSIAKDVLFNHPKELAELHQAIGSLATAWGDVRVRIDTRQVKELTKIELAEKIRELGWQHVVLAKGDSVEEAKYDATLFSYDMTHNLALQVNLEQASELEIQELVMRGVCKVGLFTIAGLDLAKTIHQY